jgi:hypothetical protein
MGTLGRQDAMRRKLSQPPLAMPYLRTACTAKAEHVGR